MSATFESIMTDLERKRYAGVYVLDGEEPYFIDEITNYLEDHVLNQGEKDFNQVVLYGRDVDAGRVINESRSYPVFAERRVVIIKEASQLKDFNKLELYLEKPLSSTILLIAHKHKKIDGRSNLSKLIKKNAVYFTSEKVKDYRLADWIYNYGGKKGVDIEKKDCETLAAYLGNDLQKITNEIDKILINIGGQKKITSDHIEKYIGISREFNVFELPQALTDRDVERVFRMVNYFAGNPRSAPMILVLGALYNHFSKLYNYYFNAAKDDKTIATVLKINPFFVKDYKKASQSFSFHQVENVILLLHEYNLKTLGIDSTADDAALLKELIIKILYV